MPADTHQPQIRGSCQLAIGLGARWDSAAFLNLSPVARVERPMSKVAMLTPFTILLMLAACAKNDPVDNEAVTPARC